MHNKRRVAASSDAPKRSTKSKKPRSSNDSTYGHSLLYIKFLAIWAAVLMLDFLLEFRFEYLWPCWLLLKSLQDTYKYQGLHLVLFFLFIALSCDVLAYCFVPEHLIFFFASVYVWIQFVWQTDRGICLSTVCLWTLFIYVEFSVRLRDAKAQPFYVDLCRPFAAHSIGFPVVTMGFGVKTYMSYKFRLRKQREVQQENSVFQHLLEQSLPLQCRPSHRAPELSEWGIMPAEDFSPYEETADEVSTAPTPQANGDVVSSTTTTNTSCISTSKQIPKKKLNVSAKTSPPPASSTTSTPDEDLEFCETKKSSRDVNQFNNAEADKTKNKKLCYNFKENNLKKTTPAALTNGSSVKSSKEEVLVRYEAEAKRLRAELQSSRSCEAELRSQLASLMLSEKAIKMEQCNLRQDNESLQNRLHNLVQRSQSEKAAVAVLEKKLAEEKKARQSAEAAAERERRGREDAEARAVWSSSQAQQQPREAVCGEACRNKRRELEAEAKQLRRDMRTKEETARAIESELREASKRKEPVVEQHEVLMSALNAMKERNVVLEKALREENKMKQELLSALHNARRDIDVLQNIASSKDREITDLKMRLAEYMAVNMNMYSGGNTPPPPAGSPSASS